MSNYSESTISYPCLLNVYVYKMDFTWSKLVLFRK